MKNEFFRKRPRIAILHDMFCMRGGGERLVLTLAAEMADTLCFGARNLTNSFDPAEFCKNVKMVHLGASRLVFGIRTLHIIYAFSKKTAFLNEHDVAVYSGIFSPLAVHNGSNVKNVFYCHTPPRFVYDQRKFLLATQHILQRPIMSGYINWYRPKYEAAVRKMDIIIANSQTVQRRIKHYLGLDSVVVNPPCDTNRFKWLGQDDFYLSSARLEPLKRVEAVVRAFCDMPEKRLVVTSGGTEMKRLQRIARGAGNIVFTGWVNDDTLFELMGKCIATLYIPREEDFGMSPVESMSAGKPVIGVAEGGLQETILHEQTGLLLSPDFGISDIQDAVRWLHPQRALSMREDCERRAQEFSSDKFLEKMRSHLAG